MQHLSEEQLVLLHYRDLDDAAAREHFERCDFCGSEYQAICRILALVDSAPLPDRDSNYGTQVWNRVRWNLQPRRSRLSPWLMSFAAAAILALVFFAGQMWHARSASVPSQIAQTTDQPTETSSGASAVRNTTTHEGMTKTTASIEPAGDEEMTTTRARQIHVAAGTTPHARSAATGGDVAPAPPTERVLLLVLGDHFESSERMLVELANADPKSTLDITSEQKRSQDLLASNRIYRQTAAQNGDRRVASVLDDLEPILVEIAHSPSHLSAAELDELQKRIEAKGILFKVRVIGSKVDQSQSHAPNHHYKSL